MAVLSIMSKLTECSFWQYNERWGELGLLGVAVLSLALLVAAGRAQARSRD